MNGQAIESTNQNYLVLRSKKKIPKGQYLCWERIPKSLLSDINFTNPRTACPGDNPSELLVTSELPIEEEEIEELCPHKAFLAILKRKEDDRLKLIYARGTKAMPILLDLETNGRMDGNQW